MQLINGAQFLNVSFLLILFTGAPAAAVFRTVIVALTCTFNHINLTLSLKFLI